MNNLEYLDKLIENKKFISFISHLSSITMRMYCHEPYGMIINFLGYLLYYPDHIFFDFKIVKDIINSNIQHLIDSGVNVVIEANDYKEHHNIIIKYFKSHILIDENGYSSYSYSIINNPNNIHTYDTIKLLLKYQYVPTNNDIVLIKDLMKTYIYDTIIKTMEFFIYFNVIKDIKTVIFNLLSRVILNEKAPIYFNIYNTIMDH